MNILYWLQVYIFMLRCLKLSDRDKIIIVRCNICISGDLIYKTPKFAMQYTKEIE